jgi:hypothetical protein
VDEVAKATETLLAAAMALRYDGSRRPASDELRLVWPDLGRAWIAAWVTELGRDAAAIAADLNAAREVSTDDDALTPLEKAASRVSSGRLPSQ